MIMVGMDCDYGCGYITSNTNCCLRREETNVLCLKPSEAKDGYTFQ